MLTITQIVAICICLTTIVLFIIIYAVPYFKGTMISGDTCHKYTIDHQPCKKGTVCCKDPKSSDEASACFKSSSCSDIRLETASETGTNFFQTYIIIVLVILLLYEFYIVIISPKIS